MLKILNVVIFQWLFVRLTRCQSTSVEQAKIEGIEMVNINNIQSASMRASILKRTVRSWYTIQGFIVPTTGWNGDFKRIGKQFNVRISKVKVIDS